MRPSVIAAYAAVMHALDGADARTVMTKMSEASALLGATNAERAAALATSAPARRGGAPPVPRVQKRKALAPAQAIPGTRFLGKTVRVWWGDPYNAFFIGRAVEYHPATKMYTVVYNEGALDEEHAQEDLESMSPANCKIVPATKNALLAKRITPPTPPPGAARDNMDAYYDTLDFRIKKSRNLKEVGMLSNELDARMAQLKTLLGDDDDDDDADDDAFALRVANLDQEDAELGLVFPDADLAASPSASAHTPRDMGIGPSLLATPAQRSGGLRGGLPPSPTVGGLVGDAPHVDPLGGNLSTPWVYEGIPPLWERPGAGPLP
jgi:hypothetical protein